jgi:hypothetical protein
LKLERDSSTLKMAFFGETLLDQQIENFRGQDLYNFAWITDEVLENVIHASLVTQLKENVPTQRTYQGNSQKESSKVVEYVAEYGPEPLVKMPKALLPTIRNRDYYAGEWGMWDNQIYYWDRKDDDSQTCRYELSQYN